MTVKALKKQLMAAIAMVVVSAIALSSSTYAWFASNNKVEATGLTIKAQSEAGILISHHEDNDYKTSTSGIHTSAVALYPTSTEKGSVWFHASAQTTSASTAVEGSMKTLALTEAGGIGADGESKSYYIVDSFDIYTTGVANNLVLDGVTVSNGSARAFNKSMRILLTCGTGDDAKAYVVAPNYEGTTNVSYTIGVNPDGNTAAGTTVTAYTPTNNKTNVLAPSVSNNKATPTVVKVYVYFEGEDTNHYTDNLTQIDDLGITLTFAAEVVAGN